MSVDISAIDGHVDLCSFMVNTIGHGLGPKLLQVLSTSLGPDVPMCSAIDHEVSDSMLENEGWYEKADTDPTLTIDNRDILIRFPIVRVFERGGFQVNKICFHHEPDEVFAVLYATTVK